MATTRWYEYRPDYRFLLQQANGSVWSLRTLTQTQALLTTGSGVNQLSATFLDPQGFIANTVNPQPMQLVQLQTKNMWGQWGVCWTGYVDTVRSRWKIESGDTLELVCTGPVKLWEITQQTPDDVASLAIAYANNISGSAVLQYSAARVGYPDAGLIIDLSADSGSGYWGGINAGVLVDPQQGAWSSVIQSLLADSGLEWFFDEVGRSFWRPVGFLAPAYTPRRIDESEIIDIGVARSDSGVFTRVEVRYGLLPMHQGTPYREAPPAMVKHLFARNRVAYAPWIQSPAAAQWLADTLLDQYAAGVLTADITIPADPKITVGSVIKVPVLNSVQATVAPNDFPGKGGSLYYVSSVMYDLSWNDLWTMTLGLTYGRASTQQFPYFGAAAYPQVTDAVAGGFPTNSTIVPLQIDQNNSSKVTTPFTLVVQRGLKTNQVSSATFAPGATIAVTDSGGRMLGPTPNGEYTVVAAPAGQSGLTLGLASVDTTQGFVTYISDGSGAAAQTSGGPGTGQTQQSSAFYAVNPATGKPGPPGTGRGNPATAPATTHGPTNPTGIAETALAMAVGLQGLYYENNAAGPSHWDCSGLVAWVYTQLGFTGLLAGGHLPDGSNTDYGPGAQWTYFQSHGGVPIDVDRTQPGDLIFIQEPKPWPGFTAGQGGIGHVGFVLKAGGFGSGVTYGANNPTDGLRSFTIAEYRSDFGTKIDLALDMSRIHA